MPIAIRERMEVAAPADVVWRWMLDASNVVACLPGATLVEVKDDRHFVGQMKVKVGTVSVTYVGDIAIDLRDDAAHRVVISGKWKEKQGAGSATMRIEGLVAEKSPLTEVTFDGTADVAGRIAQFGRGMVDGVAKELFKQFAATARQRLEATAAPAAPEGPAQPPPPQPESLSALPLVWRALWTSIKNFFARLFGRS